MTPPVRSVSQAFAIMRWLVDRDQPATLSDISRAIGLSVSTCLNLLRTLVAEGALECDSGKRYRVSEDWVLLPGLRDVARARLINRARPMLVRFAQEHDATIGLWSVEPNDRLELISLGESNSSTRIHMAEGQRQPIGSGSAGRAIAAALDVSTEELRRRFSAVRWRRELSWKRYAEEVSAAAKLGYAVDDGFAHPGVYSIAAAIPSESPSLCVSASFFAETRNPAEVDALGKALAALAGQMRPVSPGRRI